jgi:PAS domain S-box-containing protein
VILVSARAGEESRVEGLQAGADDYLIKPFVARELLARVAAHVKMANLRRETAEREERLRSEAEFEREKLRSSEERLAETSRLYDELRRADAELQLQAGLLHRLPVSAWTLNPDGTPDFVNQVWLDYSGQTLDFIRSHPEAWMTAVHPEDRETASKSFWEGVRSGTGFAFETRSLRANDGTYRWHLNQAVVLRDAEGSVLKFVGTTTDIDNQKRAEEALRASEIGLRQTLDTIPGLVSKANSNGMMEHANRQLLAYFGKTTEEMNSWSTNDVVHPDDLPRVTAEITHSFKTGTPFDSELRYRRADGVYRWFQGRSLPFRGANGEIAGWYFLLTDIEDRKRAEEALRESEHESRLIVDSIPGLIAVLDKSGEIYRVSQPLLDYLGRSQEQLRQWAVDDTIHPDDRAGYLQAFERAFAAGDPVEYEAARIRRFDGVYRWLTMRGRPLRDRHGHIVRWYFLLTEIDDRKRAEDALRQAQSDLARINRVTTIGELTASLAHEISQPISGAMTNANVGLRKLAGDNPNLDEVRGIFARIARDAQRATEIISRTRSQFEKGTPNQESLNVNEIIPETIALLRDQAARHSISIRTELAADLPQIIGDRVQLQQVVMNLIVNSIDAMKDVDGTRELVVQSRRAENEQILVSFSDTGIGLPPQLAEQIFDPFFTTKPHGTGMGLRISRSIIESHGGRLWATSSAGRGATFQLSLPAAILAHE